MKKASITLWNKSMVAVTTKTVPLNDYLSRHMR